MRQLIDSNRLHKALESAGPLLSGGLTDRLYATNWSRFDATEIDFGSAGRCSELLPAFNQNAAPIAIITAAPGIFSRLPQDRNLF